MHFLLALFFLVLAWRNGEGASDDPAIPFMEYLDSDHLVCLKWGFSDLNGTITFTLIINTTGWVGFGLSPNGGMRGSDIVIGGLGPHGSYFADRYATGDTLPLVDKQQSYTLLSVGEAEGQTTMTFQRPIQSCDDQDFHITAKPIKLIYAYGINDDISYHGQCRGTKEVNLLNYMPRVTLPSLSYFSVTMNNVLIPPIETYYHCRILKLQKLQKKHHVYRIEPVIKNPDIVHHMLLYSCHSSVNETLDNSCNIVNDRTLCINMVTGWGTGGGAFELPENAGIPFGGETNDRFYRLEMHYNNPTTEEGRRDSSGFKLYYTAQLQQHDVGLIDVGVVISQTYKIPPNATQFHTYGVCNTTLFSKLHPGPVPDLHAFAVGLHTHLAGRKVRVGLFR
ncbi:hypothetical protein LDENG_00192190 [Lucifuga dentata]|nr:hypothetical protein LDENG_00192190 [Lucifuga dentata]